jgi:hypothetical protein
LIHIRGTVVDICRKAAMEWMREQGEYSQEEVDLMQSKLRIRWREDDPTVPKGWKTRTSQIRSKVRLEFMLVFFLMRGIGLIC